MDDEIDFGLMVSYLDSAKRLYAEICKDYTTGGTDAEARMALVMLFGFVSLADCVDGLGDRLEELAGEKD
ncbi:MAG: hypothetical protein ACREQD_02520 [Candidatus Binataceae bacterium]